MSRNIRICLIAMILILGKAQAVWYWGPKAELTESDRLAFTSANNTWCIANGGGKLHVAFAKEIAANSTQREIYHRKSTNFGRSWSDAFQLTMDTLTNARSPSIGVWGTDSIHVLWNWGTTPNTDEGRYIVSRSNRFGGDPNEWGDYEQATLDLEYGYHPSLCCEFLSTYHPHAYAVWRRYFNLSPDDIRYRYGTLYGGFTWNGDASVPISDPPWNGHNDFATVCSRSQTLGIAYQEYTPGGPVVYYNSSSHDDTSWPESDSLGEGMHPSIAYDGTYEYVAYEHSNGITIQHRQSTSDCGQMGSRADGVKSRFLTFGKLGMLPCFTVSADCFYVSRWMTSHSASEN